MADDIRHLSKLTDKDYQKNLPRLIKLLQLGNKALMTVEILRRYQELMVPKAAFRWPLLLPLDKLDWGLLCEALRAGHSIIRLIAYLTHDLKWVENKTLSYFSKPWHEARREPFERTFACFQDLRHAVQKAEEFIQREAFAQAANAYHHAIKSLLQLLVLEQELVKHNNQLEPSVTVVRHPREASHNPSPLPFMWFYLNEIEHWRKQFINCCAQDFNVKINQHLLLNPITTLKQHPRTLTLPDYQQVWQQIFQFMPDYLPTYKHVLHTRFHVYAQMKQHMDFPDWKLHLMTATQQDQWQLVSCTPFLDRTRPKLREDLLGFTSEYYYKRSCFV